MSHVVDVADEQQTAALAALLAATLEAGDVIALVGTLAAGKTRFVQALAAALGVADDVTSPTFLLVHQYAGRLPLVHVDAYRIRDEDEFAELGPEEWFESGAVTCIEWADRVTAMLPLAYLEVRIETTGLSARRFVMIPHGARGHRLARALASPPQGNDR